MAPVSKWRLYRHRYDHTALADVLGTDADPVEVHKLYACLDRVPAHKTAIFSYPQQSWRDLFNAGFDLLPYDLTSTYFEANRHSRKATSVALAIRVIAGPIACGW
jgi:hypothetical protein